MRTSTSGTGSPCLQRIRIRSSSGQSCIPGLSRESVPSGEVSVIPQACSIRSPCRAIPSISAGGRAEPPHTTVRTLGSLVPVFSRYCSSAIHTVGTPAATVTPSWRINSTRLAGSRNRSGRAWVAPTMVATYG